MSSENSEGKRSFFSQFLDFFKLPKTSYSLEEWAEICEQAGKMCLAVPGMTFELALWSIELERESHKDRLNSKQ